MQKIFFPLLALSGSLLLAPVTFAAEADTTPASDVDLSRYLGNWHETARIENFFERGLHDVTALYEMLADGTIRVTNSGTAADGQRHEAVGKARRQEGERAGALEVSFVPPYSDFYSDYRILYVTPDYSGALVSDAEGNKLWLLERSEKGDPDVQQQLLQEAQQRGFDTAELIYPDELAEKAAASEAEVDAN